MVQSALAGQGVALVSYALVGYRIIVAREQRETVKVARFFAWLREEAAAMAAI